MIANDIPTFSKEYAFKLAIVNKFERTTFAEFIFALRQEMDRLSMQAEKITVCGVDCHNHKFSFNVESFDVEHDNTCMELRICYKWDASEDRASNWHWQTIIMTETSYIRYMRDADLVYKKENDIKTVDSDFEQWKEDNPLAYEVIFTLISYYGKKHGRSASSEMYFIKCNFKDRIIGNVISTDCAGLHCPKVNHFTINDFIVLSKKVCIKLNGLTYTNVLGRTIKIDYTHPASVIDVEYDIIQKISNDVDAAYDEKRRMAKETDCEDKPTYKKPGVTYQHVSTASNGSTETQKEIERIIKNSSYGMQANEKYLASTIEGAIRKKLIDENDISVGDFEGVKDAFSFEYYGTNFKAYIKSIAYVTAEGQPGATWKLIKLNDLIVSTDDNQGTELDIRIDSVACYGSHFDLRRGGLTDAITGVHVSRVKREWFDYLNRKHMKRLGKAAVHHLEPITPVTYNPADVELCMDFYNYLNEKETIKMKKIIINHNAVIVLMGRKDSAGQPIKTVVKILDPDTKMERGQWNTKLAVVSALAKGFEHTRDGKHSTCYKLYEMLNTISKPTNATIDFVADEMYQGGKRLKCCKWYQEAIKVKRPEPGKQVEIVIE